MAVAKRGQCDDKQRSGDALPSTDEWGWLMTGRQIKARSRSEQGGGAPVESLWAPRTLVAALLFGEGLAALLALGSDRATWVFFGVASLAAQWIILLTLGGLFLLRRPLANVDAVRIPYLTLLAMLCATLLVLLTGSIVLPGLATDVPGGWNALAARSLAIVTLVGVLGLIAFENHRQARHMAVRAKQAELDLLRARIRPHFLFNTLNTATALIHRRPDEAERVLLDLSDLFRAALAAPSAILLAQELELARRYLEIEALRFGDRMQLEWSIPATLPDVFVPPLSIQPLVENAVRHGVERSRHGGMVSVRISIEPRDVVVEIRNTRPGDDALPAPGGHGLGLRASIAGIDAATAGLGTVSTTQEGDMHVIRVRLPLAGPAVR